MTGVNHAKKKLKQDKFFMTSHLRTAEVYDRAVP